MTTPEPVRIDRASTLSRVFQLQAVTFTSIEARQLGTPEPGATLQWDLPIVDVVWRTEGRQLDVHLPFELKVVSSGTKDEIYEVAVSILVHYEAREGATVIQENCRDFAGINGFLHAWPYLRTEVQSLSVKIGFPPLTLPAIVVDVVPGRVRVGPPLVLTTTPVDMPAPVPSEPPKRVQRRGTRKGKSAAK